MAIKLIGIDGAKPSQANLNVVQPINPADFRGVAYQVEANLLDAEYELRKQQILNRSAVIKQQAAQSSSVAGTSQPADGSSSSSSNRGSGTLKPGDVTERERFEYEKAKDQRDFQFRSQKEGADVNLSERKFQEDVYRDRRDFQAKRGDAQAKSEAEKQYAMAQQDVEEFTLKAQEFLRSGGGMTQVREGLSKILAKYPGLDGDAQRDLIKQIYQPAQTVMKEQIDNTQAKLKEIQGYNRTTQLQQQRVQLQGLMVRLDSAVGNERASIMTTLNKQLSQIANNPEIDPVDRAFIVSQLTEDIVKNGRGGAEAADLMRRYDGYMQEAAQLHTRRNSISPQQYAYEESRLVNRYNLQGTNVARLNDPYMNEKKILDTEQTLKQLADLRNQKFLDNKFGITAERGAIGMLAKQYDTPAGVEALRAYAQRNGNPPGLKMAEQIAQGLVDYRRDYYTTQSKVNEFNKEIALLEASTAEQVLGMMSRGGTDISSMALFQQLAPDVQKMFASGQLSPEVRQQFIQQYAAARQRAITNIRQQRNVLQQSLNVKRQEIELYTGKDAFAAYESFQQNKGQIQQQRQQRTPIGVSPRRQPTPTESANFANNALQQLQNMGK